MTLLLIFTALADEPQIVYKEKTEIDFEAVELEGQIKKPMGDIIVERIKAQFNPLVPIREEFVKEMTQSLNDIK